MDIEDLVRATAVRQAEQAVPIARVRSALPARIERAGRRRRAGRFAAVAVAAGAAVAIAVPVLALQRNEPVTPAATADPPPSSAAAVSRPAAVGLGYRPTWAPPGFAERIRAFSAADPGDSSGPVLQRVWAKQVGPGDPWGGALLTLYVRTGAADAVKAAHGTGSAVDISGHKGYYSADAGKKSYLTWAIGAHTWLILSADHLNIAQADLLRMARSVRPDSGTNVVPLVLRWLPPTFTTTGSTVSGPSAAAYRTEVTASQPNVAPVGGDKSAKSGPGTISVVVGTVTDAPAGGKKLTVSGHPARNPVRADAPGQGLIYLVVDLGQGRVMTLIGSGGGLTLTDLTRVAEGAEVTPAFLDWLGR